MRKLASRSFAWLAAISILAILFARSGRAATEADEIREQLRQVKQDYQQRIDALEERLRKLESASAAREFAKEQFQQYIVSQEEGGPTEYKPLGYLNDTQGLTYGVQMEALW